MLIAFASRPGRPDEPLVDLEPGHFACRLGLEGIVSKRATNRYGSVGCIVPTLIAALSHQLAPDSMHCVH
jgi:hypothetical protein